MKVSLIVAMASNRVIGANNKMPWHLPADLKRFRQITWASPILMGRHTHEAIGRPLPGRTNIVVTRNVNYQAPGCLVCHNLDAAQALACQTANQLFVIGGSALYEAFLPLADTLYLTEIKIAFAGDTFFPPWSSEGWHEHTREDVYDDADAGFDYSFLQYTKKASQALTNRC